MDNFKNILSDLVVIRRFASELQPNIQNAFGCFAKTLIFGGLLLLSTNLAWADKYTEEKGLGWASLRNLTHEQYADRFDQYRNRGWMLIDVEAYPVGKDIRYAMVWRDNHDNRGWRQWRNMTSSGYNQRWNEMRAAGFRPTDVEGYMIGNNLRFAGIWVENRENLRWASNRNMTTASFAERHEERIRNGLRPVDIEAYDTPNGLRWAAIWYQDSRAVDWVMRTNLTRQQYQDQVDTLGREGYQVRDYETYNDNGQRRYAAIWERHENMPAYQLRTDRNDQQYSNLWNEYRDRGYRVADFEADEVGTNVRYAGIWVENNERLRYRHRTAIDKLIQDYQNLTNPPGISVAIIHRGQSVYRRGFGEADPAKGHGAHGQTVYSAASISKVFGATLAAKLEAEGQLQDGSAVALDLNQTTQNYLTQVPILWPINNMPWFPSVTLPAHHTHTVEQLTAHLGCVVHYSTTPGVSNSSMVGQYPTALLSALNFWEVGLVTNPNCSVGNNRSYSTHAYTLVGAVLERVTGRTVHQLVKSEIADGWGLSSVRSQFEVSPLTPNPERAVPHSNNGNSFSYTNSSWKVFGGGMEMHVVDLAQFGWRVLDGQIVSSQVRDQRLWAPVASGCTFGQGGICRNGLGWALFNTTAGPYVEHGGQGSGARTLLRIYPNDELVIAIMMNRSHTGSGASSPNSLARDIADLIR